LPIIECAESALKGQIQIPNNPNEGEMNADRQLVVELEASKSHTYESVMGDVPVREARTTPADFPRHEKRWKWVDAALELEAEVEGCCLYLRRAPEWEEVLRLAIRSLTSQHGGSHERGARGSRISSRRGLAALAESGFCQVNLLTHVEPNTGLSIRECKVGLGGKGLTSVDGIRPERRANRQSSSLRCTAVRGDTFDLSVTGFYAVAKTRL